MEAGSRPGSARDAFVAELRHWRKLRGLSQKQLAARMGYDASYISKIEGRHLRPTEDFARRADAVLRAGTTIWRRWRDFDDSQRSAGRPTPRPLLPALSAGHLVVDHDEARLRYGDRLYHALVRRRLTNLTDAPITRFLVRVAVDRFPEDSARSNRFYHEHPLTLDELDLRAR